MQTINPLSPHLLLYAVLLLFGIVAHGFLPMQDTVVSRCLTTVAPDVKLALAGAQTAAL
jgi:hypothetical protein